MHLCARARVCVCVCVCVCVRARALPRGHNYIHNFYVWALSQGCMGVILKIDSLLILLHYLSKSHSSLHILIILH